MTREERITIDVKKTFNNHIAKYWKFGGNGAPIVEMIRFGRPGTRNYSIEFVLTSGTLMVHGDLGEAVYCWHSDIDFDFLAGVEVGYMASKCQASEVGRDFVEWDGDEGRLSLKEHLECQDEELESFMKNAGFDKNKNGEYTDDQYKTACTMLTEKRFHGIMEKCNIDRAYEWAADINTLLDPEEEFHDTDYWDWVYRVGEVPHIRLYCHFIGMKLAIKQIQTKRITHELRDMNCC